MRVTTAFCRLLRLDGVRVCSVLFEADRVLVVVALRRRRLICPCCAYSTRGREGTQAHESVWRHLDLGVWRLEIRATLRQLRCPVHGVHVEGVPFARHRARFTRDLEDLVAWLATRTDKTAITRLARIDWQTVGRIISRVADEQLDERRLDDLFVIGIDEIAWRGGHRYLTLVTDHQAGKIVWGAEGRSAAVADRFFAELDPPAPAPDPADAALAPADAQPCAGPRASQLTAFSMDMGPGYAKSVREHAPQAVICIDPCRRPHRPLLLTRRPQPPQGVRPLGQDDRKAPRRHPRRRDAEDQQRPRRSAQQQGTTDHPPRLRLSLRPRRTRAHPPHLRPDQPQPPARGDHMISPPITHGEPGNRGR